VETVRLKEFPKLEEPGMIGFEHITNEIRQNVSVPEPVPVRQGNVPITTEPTKQGIINEIRQSPPSNTTTDPPRPVPAPRSSLLTEKTGPKGAEVPVVKERPSLKAKPRDLSGKRSQECHSRNSSGSGIEEEGGGGGSGSSSRANSRTDSALEDRKYSAESHSHIPIGPRGSVGSEDEEGQCSRIYIPFIFVS
jgi:hypothetical protein